VVNWIELTRALLARCCEGGWVKGIGFPVWLNDNFPTILLVEVKKKIIKISN
jgi:hypothetical protein